MNLTPSLVWLFAARWKNDSISSRYLTFTADSCVIEVDLSYTQTGVPPSRNVDAMRKVLEALALEGGSDIDEEIVDVSVLEPVNPEKKKRKRKSEAMEVDPEVEREQSPSKKRKKEKGDKEHKKEKKEKKIEGMNARRSGMTPVLIGCGSPRG
jgi:GTP cyclohydrolase FolE2